MENLQPACLDPAGRGYVELKHEVYNLIPKHALKICQWGGCKANMGTSANQKIQRHTTAISGRGV